MGWLIAENGNARPDITVLVSGPFTLAIDWNQRRNHVDLMRADKLCLLRFSLSFILEHILLNATNESVRVRCCAFGSINGISHPSAIQFFWLLLDVFVSVEQLCWCYIMPFELKKTSGYFLCATIDFFSGCHWIHIECGIKKSIKTLPLC